MALRPHIQDGLGRACPSLLKSQHIALTPEQDYRVRVMGEEELELLRAAASQRGLELTSLNWILASLMNHGFVSISGDNRRLRAVATKAGCLALAIRPLLPDDALH
jgi:hypothetical protein